MRAVFKVRPEVRIKVYVDDNKFHVQANKAREATETARTVYEDLKMQRHMTSPTLS